jgi:hypothetical protein
MRKPAKQRAKEAKAMLANVAQQAVADAFNKAFPLACDIGSPMSTQRFCRWFNAAMIQELVLPQR